VDAEAAARAVLAGTARTVPKSGDDWVEMVRVLRIVSDHPKPATHDRVKTGHLR
jgi:hypothetical protein